VSTVQPEPSGTGPVGEGTGPTPASHVARSPTHVAHAPAGVPQAPALHPAPDKGEAPFSQHSCDRANCCSKRIIPNANVKKREVLLMKILTDFEDSLVRKATFYLFVSLVFRDLKH
jgi:hypothetical protein